ncbi:MAG: DUF3558 family protein [Mycobacterium sp.]
MPTVTVRVCLVVAACAALAVGCGGRAEPSTETADAAASPADAFHGEACNGVTDAEISSIAGTGMFTKVVDGDVGCFWQENTLIGSVGEGMGISTWWYRGSDLDTERMLEQEAGRELTELSVGGNKGFEASDDNACSVYVSKGGDVITWSIQTLNPASFSDLCEITEQLAQLSQDRVN